MMEKKYICFVNSAKAWGGGEKWHFDAATYLNEQKMPVISLVHSKGELLQRLKMMRVAYFASDISNLSFLNPLKILRLILFFRRNRVETIIMNMPADVKAAGIAAWIAGVRHRIYRRGSDIPVKNTILNRLLFRHVITGIIANSEATKKSINQNTILFPPDRIKVIYNGIDTDIYIDLKQKTFDKNKIIIGNLGRLVHQKGQKYLIEIARILKQRNIPFSMIIGGDGPMNKELMEEAENSGVSDEVIFEGFVEDTASFMEKIDIFVLSSLWEGFGYVIAEAMLSGKPVIAFEVSSNRELIKHGKTGFLVKPFEIDSFADHIVRFYENPELISKLGQNGRQIAIARFSKERMYSMIVEYLGRL